MLKKNGPGCAVGCCEEPPPPDNCDFECEGEEPDLLGIILVLGGQGAGYSTDCSCSGSGTYALPVIGPIARPPFTGTNIDCYYCWTNIPLGTCDVEVFDELLCELEWFPGNPTEVIAPCDSFPDESFGYIYGWKYCCRARIWIEAAWEADMCVHFNSDNEMVVTFDVDGVSNVIIGLTDELEIWRRKYRKYKLPGTVPGPSGEECMWTFEFIEPWELDPNYDHHCPPPEPTEGGVFATVVHTQHWEATVPIDECDEILLPVELALISQTPSGNTTIVVEPDDMVCQLYYEWYFPPASGWITPDTEFCPIPPFVTIVIPAGWGCMPGSVETQWTT